LINIAKIQWYFRYALKTNNVAYISILLERPIHVIKAGVNKVRNRDMLLRKDLGH